MSNTRHNQLKLQDFLALKEKALQIILDNRVIIDLIVERLLDVETMEGDEFRELLSTYTILPNKKAAYISKLA